MYCFWAGDVVTAEGPHEKQGPVRGYRDGRPRPHKKPLTGAWPGRSASLRLAPGIARLSLAKKALLALENMAGLSPAIPGASLRLALLPGQAWLLIRAEICL